MKVFLDANILISVLNKEFPVFPYSSRILSLGQINGYELYTSPICLAIAFYFSEKKSGSTLAKKKIGILASKLLITSVGTNEVFQAVLNPRVLDLEDGLEYYAAIGADCDVIVTEDLGDFHFSDIPVFDCQGFVRRYFG
jgi:predicted nucleic acid-binding protein